MCTVYSKSHLHSNVSPVPRQVPCAHGLLAHTSVSHVLPIKPSSQLRGQLELVQSQRRAAYDTRQTYVQMNSSDPKIPKSVFPMSCTRRCPPPGAGHVCTTISDANLPWLVLQLAKVERVAPTLQLVQSAVQLVAAAICPSEQVTTEAPTAVYSQAPPWLHGFGAHAFPSQLGP